MVTLVWFPDHEAKEKKLKLKIPEGVTLFYLRSADTIADLKRNIEHETDSRCEFKTAGTPIIAVLYY